MLSRLRARPEKKKPSKSALRLYHPDKFTITPMLDISKHKVLLVNSVTQIMPEDTQPDPEDIELSLPNLPDVPLLNIFAYLPIRDQQRLGSTCTRLHQLLKHVFLTRKSLTILLGGDPLWLVCDCEYKLSGFVIDETEIRSRSVLSQLSFDELQLDTVNRITSVFPVITQLSLAFHDATPADIHEASTLLYQLSPTLTTLKLYLCLDLNCQEQLDLLMSTLNGLQNLKNLTLYVQGWLDYDLTGEIDLPILSQLQEFTLYSLDEPAFMVDSLIRYALPNQKLITRIGCVTMGDHAMDIDSQFTFCFTHFEIINSSSVLQILGHFSSLTSVIVDFDSNAFSYPQLIEALSLLKQLISFTMHCNIAVIGEHGDQNLPVLSSVKMFQAKVELAYFEENFEDLGELFQVKRCFPALESVTILVICHTCYFSQEGEVKHRLHSAKKKKRCAKELMRSLRKLKIERKLFELCWCGTQKILSYEQLIAE